MLIYSVQNISNMIRLIHQKDVKHLYTIDQNNLKSNWSEITYKAMILNQNDIFYLFEEEKTLKGFIIVQIKDDSADLMQLIVDKQFQKQKIASRLLEETLKTLKHKNIKTLLLEVETSNLKALNLYKKFGFMPVHKRLNYYGNNRHAYTMQCEVK